MGQASATCLGPGADRTGPAGVPLTSSVHVGVSGLPPFHASREQAAQSSPCLAREAVPETLVEQPPSTPNPRRAESGRIAQGRSDANSLHANRHDVGAFVARRRDPLGRTDLA